MITSININKKSLTGDVRLGSDFKCTDNNTVKVVLDNSSLYANKWSKYLKDIPLRRNFPYVVSISKVRPDIWRNMWLLGGKTTQLSTERTNTSDGNITISDMAQTVDYPRIYRSVYAMLRQLRLWIDTNKDSLLLYQSEAESQWSKMLSDDGDNEWTSDDLANIYMETRDRSGIPVLAPATSFINEYVGTVALWNHIVGLPESDINIRLHPADQAGIYVGVDVIIPMDAYKDTDLNVSVSLSMAGQSGDNLYMWLRVPNASLTPGGSGQKPVVTIPGESGIVSQEPSILDEGHTINSTSAEITVSATIPTEDVRNQHVLQCVIEAIPFYLCSDDEKTYPDSKKAEHASAAGENVWTISVVITKDGEVIQELTETKKSAYTTVCPEPDESGSSTYSL